MTQSLTQHHIAITGAGGLIGSALVASLGASGHRVTRLVRRPPREGGEAQWDPETGRIDSALLEGVDAIVHLAGEGIADHRWTEKRKRLILDSRVRGTGLIARTAASLSRPPRVLVSASAMGVYGDRGDTLLDEASAPGTDFLANVCQAWESAAEPADAAGIRVVHPRFGIVLSRHGGALARQLPFFRAGIGGPLGSGRQWLSCVSLQDVVGSIIHMIDSPDTRGPLNVVCEEPARSREFARTLGRLLRRPAFAPVPAFALRLIFGELADAALLASQRGMPSGLTRSGYQLRHPRLNQALDWALHE
jgi:uncharacterized protein